MVIMRVCVVLLCLVRRGYIRSMAASWPRSPAEQIFSGSGEKPAHLLRGDAENASSYHARRKRQRPHERGERERGRRQQGQHDGGGRGGTERDFSRRCRHRPRVLLFFGGGGHGVLHRPRPDTLPVGERTLTPDRPSSGEPSGRVLRAVVAGEKLLNNLVVCWRGSEPSWSDVVRS